MSNYFHESHLFCECSAKKKFGQHVCPACWESSPQDLRQIITKLAPGCLRHISAVATLLQMARDRHPTITTLPYCPRCNRIELKPAGKELQWIRRPGCFNARPGWKIVNTICPDCATDQIVTDA